MGLAVAYQRKERVTSKEIYNSKEEMSSEVKAMLKSFHDRERARERKKPKRRRDESLSGFENEAG